MEPIEEKVDDLDEVEFDINDGVKDEDEIDIWAVDLDDEGIKDFDPDLFIDEEEDL